MLNCSSPGLSTSIDTNLLWRNLKHQALIALSEEENAKLVIPAEILTECTLYMAAIKIALKRVLLCQAVVAEELIEILSKIGRDADFLERGIGFDLQSIFERDPAARELFTPFIFSSGFHALVCHRIAHIFWNNGDRTIGSFISSRVSEVLGIDIHPAAQIGEGVMIDHGLGLVIGETCVIEHGVTLFQGVTLGGTGKETGNRHPIVRAGATIYAGASVLGRISIGKLAVVGAGALVLTDVDDNQTVVGVPARPVCL